MAATYVVGGVGVFIGFSTIQQDPPTLALSAILGVTVTGVLSFVRHAIFNRSDAVAGGWDYGRRNNFQIEVGLANLAWGFYTLLAVILDWGLKAQAAGYIVSGLYFASVTIFILFSRDLKNRRLGGFIGIAVWSVMTLWLGSAATIAAG